MIEAVRAISSVVKRLAVGKTQTVGKVVIQFGVVVENDDVWLAAVFSVAKKKILRSVSIHCATNVMVFPFIF